MNYLEMFGENLLFSFMILAIGFILGWILYDKLILKGINLKEALFDKDNLAAWIEFIGAFVLPVLFLSAKALEGSANENIWLDLLISVGYAVGYTLLFTVLRLCSGSLVKMLGQRDERGTIKLNSEIYVQKNTSAALFSVALSTIFAGAISFLDVGEGYFTAALLRALSVLVFVLIGMVAYSLVLRRRSSLFNEVFVDNNPAAGVAFAGFIFAIVMLLSNAVALQLEFNLAELVITCALWLLLFGILTTLFKKIMTSLIKVDIRKEVYEQDNVGAALGQCALYIGLAMAIINFIK